MIVGFGFAFTKLKKAIVLDADCDPNQLRNFLYDVAENIIKNDLTFKDGDIIGFSAEDEHAITRSEGVALRGLQTLKIEY